MVQVFEIDTGNTKNVRDFLDFPFQLYNDCPQWVPPMAGDARLRLDRQRYAFYRHSDASFFLARDKSTTVGRIAVLEHEHHNTAMTQSQSGSGGEGEKDQVASNRRDAFFVQASGRNPGGNC